MCWQLKLNCKIDSIFYIFKICIRIFYLPKSHVHVVNDYFQKLKLLLLGMIKTQVLYLSWLFLWSQWEAFKIYRWCPRSHCCVWTLDIVNDYSDTVSTKLLTMLTLVHLVDDYADTVSTKLLTMLTLVHLVDDYADKEQCK